MKSDENERDENLYSTAKSEMISSVSDEMLSHHSCSVMHHQLKRM